MEFSTLRTVIAIVATCVTPAMALAFDPGAAKLQQSFADQMVTVRIGRATETHNITIATYQTLLNQGVPATLVDMPLEEQDQLHQLMLKSAGWSVGVFR